MKTSIRISLLFLLISLCTALDRYPRWFLFPEQYPDIITGFSYNGYDPVVDAERMACVYDECIVSGSLDQYLYFDKKNSDYYYTFDAAKLDEIHDKLVPRETFFIHMLTGDMVTAFTLSGAEFDAEPFLDIDSLEVPFWMNSSFSEDGEYFYGVGMYTSRANKNDAWKTAEEKAFFSIMNGLVTDIFSVTTMTSDDTQSRIDVLHSNHLEFILSGLQVCRRYPDNQNHLFYVRVKIPKSGVVIPNRASNTKE